MKKRFFIAIITTLTISSIASITIAALTNVHKKVRSVDLSGNVVVIWVDELSNPPDCRDGDEYLAVTCDLENDIEFCKAVISTALAAKLSDTEVEFSVNGCLGSAAKLSRFRTQL